jgi:hypothetical protein
VSANGSSLEVGAGRIYVRFDEEATGGAGGFAGAGGDEGEEASPVATLIDCPIYFEQETSDGGLVWDTSSVFPVAPGDVVEQSFCGQYEERDGVRTDYIPGCVTREAVVEDGQTETTYYCQQGSIEPDGSTWTLGYEEIYVGIKTDYERVSCDEIHRGNGTSQGEVTTVFRQERVDVPLEPGETVTVASCGNYVLLKGEVQEPHFTTHSCQTFELTFEEYGPVNEIFCREIMVSLQDGTVEEYGFEGIYVKREMAP